jgi:hypothetical protein
MKHTYKQLSQSKNINQSLFELIAYFDNSPKKIHILENEGLNWYLRKYIIYWELKKFDGTLSFIQQQEWECYIQL